MTEHMLVLMVSPAFVSLLAIVALRLVMMTTRSPDRVRYLFQGYVFVFVGEVAMAGRVTPLAPLFLVAANTMIIVGLAFVAQGARETVGAPRQRWVPGLAAAVVTVPYIFLATHPELIGVRVVIGSAVAGAMHLWAAAPLMRCDVGRYTPVARGAGGFFLIATGVLVVRALLVFILPSTSNPFDPSVVVNIAMFVTLNVMKLFSVVAVGLLISATLMREAEQQSERLQEERDRFQLILNRVPGVVWEADAETVAFSFVSAQSKDVLGFDPEKWLEQGFWESRIHPDDRDDAINFCAERTQELQDHEVQYRFYNSAGEVVWLHDAVAVVAEEGKPKWLRGVMVDITQQKELEASLRRTAQAAEAADRAKSLFLARMSHEIRTPMNGVLAMLQLALEEVPPGSLRDNLRVAEVSSIALMDLLRDILDLTRIESGNLSIQAAPVDLRDLLENVCALHRQEASKRGLQCVLDVEAGLPTWVELDGQRFAQILNNLLSNAVKFTVEGEVRVLVRWLASEEQVEVRVTDTGPGVPEELAERVFDLFEQPDRRLVGHDGGTGLGLSISRSLAQALGGTLVLEPSHGPGACFRLRVGAPAVNAPMSRDQPRAPSQRAAHALVVEDNPINQMVMAGILEQFGVPHTVVGTGEEALEALTEASSFDLVFMDIGLPGIDGYETTRRLRARQYLDGLPVVALTAAAFDEHRREAVRAGMQDFLTKPVQLADVERALERWCASASAPEANDSRHETSHS